MSEIAGSITTASLPDLALMELQAATLFRYDARGRLICANEPDGTRAPRLFLGRTRGGNIWRFRDDLPDDLVDELTQVLAAEPVAADLREPPTTLDALRSVLARWEPVSHIWAGPAWCFPAMLPPLEGTIAVGPMDAAAVQANFPWLASELAERQPCLAAVQDGTAVAVCYSARLGLDVAEAGVETGEAYRRRGYGARVVAAWAIAVRATGRLPLYSTSWDNVASQRLAASLNLILYGVDLSLT